MLSNLRNTYKSDLTGTIPSLEFPFQEGLFLKLDLINGRWWLGFEPYTFVQIPRAETPQAGNPEHPENSNADPMGARPDRGGDPAGDWRRERWAQRYNRNWASIIAAWPNFSPTPVARRSGRSGYRTGQEWMPCSKFRQLRIRAAQAITTSISIGLHNEQTGPLDKASAVHAAH
jgi:hypothetical protein